MPQQSAGGGGGGGEVGVDLAECVQLPMLWE